MEEVAFPGELDMMAPTFLILLVNVNFIVYANRPRRDSPLDRIYMENFRLF